ncbi:peptidoglycan DD-metalloendopeptidase family protein [candidate division KSB1 bacterium]|nr:peptidoglycan DD-metalloendopeptidase family protein [candidate division KSB1 bacterium]
MSKRKMIRFCFLLGGLIVGVSLRSQNTSERKLDQLKSEISYYKKKVAALEQQESSELDVLENLNRQLNLTRKLIDELKHEEKSIRKNELSTQRMLDTTKIELERLKRLIAKRLVYFYKYGRMKDLEILLSSRSINQAYLWMAYQKHLTENDVRNLENIQHKQKVISGQKAKIDSLLGKQREIIKSKQQENADQLDNRTKRRRILERIKQNKQLMVQQLRDVEQSALEIQRLIDEEEHRRSSGFVDQDLPQYSDFPQLKGKMPWPVNGDIAKKFGRVKHPKLKTITQNLGIDIRAAYGAPVKAVCEGIVSRITWIRGLGNIIMLNHYEGYYTVYARLGNILVHNGEKVSMGQALGDIGESGASDEPMLHFEIWENNKAVNPDKWLR